MSIVKKSTALLMALIMLVCVVPFSVFADGDNDECEHNYVFVAEKSETCTEDGYKAGYKCSKCGAIRAGCDPIASTGHDWVKGTPVDKTCTEDGYTPYTFSKCEETKKENVDKAPGKHDYEVKESKDASCSEAGFKKYVCKVCDDTYVENIPATKHNYESKVVAATCLKDGYTSHTCSVCGDTYNDEEKKAPGHDLGEWKLVQAGSCTDNEVKERKCSRCDYKEEDVTKAPGHDYKETASSATCTEPGKVTYTCSVCKDSYDSDFVEPLGHVIYIEPEVVADCQKTGLTQGKSCARCGEIFVAQKEIPKTGHKEIRTPQVAPTCQKEGSTERVVCEYCETVIKESQPVPKTGHKYITEVKQPATCTNSGLSQNVCEYCGDSQTIIVPALGHSYGVVTTPATCTESGLKEYKCTLCGEKQSDKNPETIPALGHSWKTEWTVDSAATCTKDGSKSHHCIRCDAKNEITPIPKAHNYKEVVVKAATTSKDGQCKKTCTVCGASTTATTIPKVKSVTLSKTSYTYNGSAKKPTVTIKDVNGKKLVKGTDYSVKYASGRKKVGTYKVTITFKGKYTGTKTLSFKIKLAQVKGVKATANDSKDNVKLTYNKVAGAKKYIVYYATSKDGKYKKLGSTTKLSYNTRAMTPEKTIYFKVRAYTKTNADKSSYGAYSSVVKAKIK